MRTELHGVRFVSKKTPYKLIFIPIIAIVAWKFGEYIDYGNIIYIIIAGLFFFAVLKFEISFLIFSFVVLVGEIYFGKVRTVVNLSFFLLTISFFLRNRLPKNAFKDNLVKLVLLLFFYEFLHLMHSFSFNTFAEVSRIFSEFIVLLGAFFIVSFYIKKPSQLYYVITTMLIIAGIESVMGILQHFTGKFYLNVYEHNPTIYNVNLPREYLGYILPSFSKNAIAGRGTFGSFTQLGVFLTFFSPLIFSIALVQEENHQRKVLFWFVSVILFLGAYFSYGRGSLIGILIALLLILLIQKKLSKWTTSLLLLGLVFLSAYHNKLIDAFTDYYASTQNVTIRLNIYKDTLAHIIKSPSTFFFGYGYSGYVDLGKFTQVSGWHPGGHNSYLDIWVSKGIIGLVPILLAFGFSIKKLVYAYKKTKNMYLKQISLGMLASLVAFGISQIFVHSLAFIWFIKIYFFTFLGISVGIKRIVNLEEQNEIRNKTVLR